MSMSRRSIMAAPVAVAAAPAIPALLSSPAAAQAAAPPAQAPGFYRFRLGEYTVTVINDGIARRDSLDGFIRNVPIEQVRAALAAEFLPTTHFDNTYNFTVLQTGRETIFFDTGTGGLLAPTAGTMWANLAAAGIDPAQADRVIITHFHADHISGLVTREGQARFPKAEILVPEGEWAFWRSERAPEAGRNTAANRFRPYEGRVRPIASNADLGGGIVGIPTHGHAPGHTSYGIQSGNASVIVLGDVTGHPVFNLTNAGWHTIFDMDAAAAEATRRALFDRAAADGTPIIGYHWGFPGVGRVRKVGPGYSVVPVQWSSGV